MNPIDNDKPEKVVSRGLFQAALDECEERGKRITEFEAYVEELQAQKAADEIKLWNLTQERDALATGFAGMERERNSLRASYGDLCDRLDRSAERDELQQEQLKAYAEQVGALQSLKDADLLRIQELIEHRDNYCDSFHKMLEAVSALQLQVEALTEELTAAEGRRDEVLNENLDLIQERNNLKRALERKLAERVRIEDSYQTQELQKENALAGKRIAELEMAGDYLMSLLTARGIFVSGVNVPGAGFVKLKTEVADAYFGDDNEFDEYPTPEFEAVLDAIEPAEPTPTNDRDWGPFY